MPFTAFFDKIREKTKLKSSFQCFLAFSWRKDKNDKDDCGSGKSRRALRGHKAQHGFHGD
jgi:hypothetical protein